MAGYPCNFGSLSALCEVVPYSADDAAGSWRRLCPTGLAFGRACVLRTALVVVETAELAARVG